MISVKPAKQSKKREEGKKEWGNELAFLLARHRTGAEERTDVLISPCTHVTTPLHTGAGAL